MAGHIPAAWLDAARASEDEGNRVEDWIAAQGNWRTVEIDAERSVWVEGAGGSWWLSQDHIDDVLARIDRQSAPPARQRLLAAIARNPQQSLTTLSETLGVSRSRISQLLAEEGYVWRPAPVRPEPPGVWVRP